MILRIMFCNRKIALQFSLLLKAFEVPPHKSFSSVFNRLNFNCWELCRCEKRFKNSRVKLINNAYSSTFSKYESFSKETAPDVLDVEEERQRIKSDEVILNKFKGANLERGINGIFEIGEIVQLLRKEKGQDIVALQIPPEYNYADYLVIVSGRSTKHMDAMCDFVRRLYKAKVGRNACLPKLEGKTSDTWKALDLGNIVLHVFANPDREVYDLETLWSVGKDFDTLTHKNDTSSKTLNDYSKLLASLTPNT